MVLSIYTDGSCWNTKKKASGARVGGIGVVVIKSTDEEISVRKISQGKFINTTSPRMEMRAFLRALQEIPIGAVVQIHTDNEMVWKSIDQDWLENWHDADYYMIKNDDIWRVIHTWYHYHLNNETKIKVFWVKGHSNNEYNEMADRLASQGRKHGKQEIECRKVNIN